MEIWPQNQINSRATGKFQMMEKMTLKISPPFSIQQLYSLNHSHQLSTAQIIQMQKLVIHIIVFISTKYQLFLFSSYSLTVYISHSKYSDAPCGLSGIIVSIAAFQNIHTLIIVLKLHTQRRNRMLEQKVCTKQMRINYIFHFK